MPTNTTTPTSMVREGARATIVVSVTGTGEKVTTSASLLRVIAEAGSRVSIVEVIGVTDAQQHLESVGIRADDDARIDVRQYALGGGTVAMAQILSSSLAAATAFALSTQIGIAGSIIGAAIGAAASACATQIYKNILNASANKLRSNLSDDGIGPEGTVRMSLAINRQALCDTLYEGTATPSGDIVPPGIAGNDETTWAYTAYDVDKAKQLLDEAGYPADANGSRGITLSIMS